MIGPRDRRPLDERFSRIVEGLRMEMAAKDSRYREVLNAIVSTNSFAFAKRLALCASDGMTPGTTGWARTSELLEDQSIHCFCKQCNGGVNGSYPCPEIYADLCPAEFGAVRYAEVCAA
jgi:hypothetical protein